IDLHQRFPGISAFLAEHGLDLHRDLVPVRPAAHYMMGGIRTELDGRTSVRGLYAAGEAACTGVHGANRLASNSLLEGLVFGARAARTMVTDQNKPEPVEAPAVSSVQLSAVDEEHVESTIACLKRSMWQFAGLLREKTTLLRGMETLANCTTELSRLAGEGKTGRRLSEARALCR